MGHYSAQQSYRGKQLHDLLYKTKVKEIQDFSHRECLLLSWYLVSISSGSFLYKFVVLILCHCILSRHVSRGMISFAVTVPQVFRESLREAGWRVGRSPVHHVVSAADGTLKVKISTFLSLSS